VTVMLLKTQVRARNRPAHTAVSSMLLTGASCGMLARVRKAETRGDSHAASGLKERTSAVHMVVPAGAAAAERQSTA
jgi:hypothetical protein